MTLPDRDPAASTLRPTSFVGRVPESDDQIPVASQRLRALATLSGSLTDALSPEEAADLVERKALSALGATSAIVVTLGAFPIVGGGPKPEPPAKPTLHVVHAIGLPAEVSAALEELPLEAPVPFAEVARTGAPRFLASENELRSYPDWGAAMIGAGASSAAIVPVWANGELRGVLGLSWADPRVFDEDERAFVLTLGVMCAQAIMRAHLRSAERVARQGAEEARDTAEKANHSKAEFVATISHELRTPMSAILGYADLLTNDMAGPITDQQRGHLERVRDSGNHLLGLIEDLLGYARIEAGHETVDAETVRVLSVVEGCLAIIDPLARAKGISMRVDAPDNDVQIHTDAGMLKRIVINLVANAVKFSDKGEVLISVREDAGAGAAEISVEVTDEGKGISETEQGHAFEPFWQADLTSRHTPGSTGLGLSVARQLARLLGGELALLRSAPAVGSTFVLTLPARYAPI
jgi:signal transduction histidine kinase